MTLTIKIRMPAGGPLGPAASRPGQGASPARTPTAGQAGPRSSHASAAGGPNRALGLLFSVAEPVALLVAEAAGVGLAGKILCATALRSAHHVLAP